MKVYFYLVITAGLMLLFNMAGVDLPSGFIINNMNILNLETFTSSIFYLALIAVLVSSAAVGIIIGSFTRTSPESSLIAGFITATLALLIGDLVSIQVQMRSLGVDWAANLSLLILAPFIVGYSLSLVEFWRGTD